MSSEESPYQDYEGAFEATRGISLQLEQAAARVAASWRGADPNEFGEMPEIERILGVLVRAAEGRADNRSDSGLSSPVGRRCLELMRQEVLDAWRNSPHSGDPRITLQALLALENVRATVEPDWDAAFASRLAAPDGLALVVEVVHDLRSPLTSILFLAETLQREQSGDINDLQHRQLGLIYSAALGLSTVASNVIELARGGDRLADHEPAPFSVTDLLESVHDIVFPMAEEKGLTVRLLPPVSDHRLGYPHALSRVLLNLTTNALKFTEQGFVELVASEKDLSTVEFSVRDTGPGIASEALNRLYAPFRYNQNGSRYSFSGTGLGLELSRRLVEAMGSRLEVDTRPGWGTRFHFDLQLRTVGT